MNSMSTVATTDPSPDGEAVDPHFHSRAGCRMPCRRSCLAPSFLITIIFVYGFIVWTAYLSFTNSKTFPS